MKEWFIELWKLYATEIKEGLLFAAFVMFGVIVKIIRAIQKGSKLSFAWFFSEALISFFIAIFVYAVVDQFFQLKPFFTYALCALLGSMSTIVNKKLEELLESLFDSTKTAIKDLFSAVIEKFKSKKL
ncbi:MAG: hypothetical protein DCE86_05340 [Flavobacteriaceae bacterium]|nr:MAG: hypothetical protein DCE86_05340 [Flavobacteriaceae bacterium]